MNINAFLKFVEINTKIASMFPFIIGTLYVVYRYNQFNLVNFILLFVSVLIFDMLTTGINNYMDFKKANKKEGYNYEVHNAIVNYKMKEKTVLTILITMLLISSLLGIFIVLRTDILVLLIGMASFGIGILYSFGPLPISRTPLGEVFSGFFMGFVILFLTIYIHVYNISMISFNFEASLFILKLKWLDIINIFLVSIPLMAGIANIMLANNICDVDDDIENKRFTLPIYLGKKMSVRIFVLIYAIAYIDIIVISILGIIPQWCLISLITLIPVVKNLFIFNKEQTKKNTFIVSVKNFILICSSLIIGFTIYLLLHQFI